MDPKVHAIARASCLRRRDDVAENGKDLERTFSVVSQMVENEQNFYVLFRNDLIGPTKACCCAVPWSLLESRLDGSTLETGAFH